MRALLVLVGIAAIAVVVLMQLGMINLNVQGGQLPKVQAATGSIDVGTTTKTVEVPTVKVKPAPTPTPAQ